MADDNTTATPTPPAAPAPPAPPDPTPPLPGLTTEDDQGGDDEVDTGNAEADKRLRAERKTRRAAERQVADLTKSIETLQGRVKQFEDRDKTDDQKRAEALEAAKAETQTARNEAAAARLELLRYQIGIEKGIAAEFIDRLRGATREEIEADADRLAPALAGQQAQQTPAPRRPAPDPRLGRNQTGPVSTEDQFAAAMKQIL